MATVLTAAEVLKRMGRAEAAFQEVLRSLYTKLYGPRHCPHCKEVTPTYTWEVSPLKIESEGYGRVHASFTGAQACTQCWNLKEMGPEGIEPPTCPAPPR